jgi:hypothetical protein
MSAYSFLEAIINFTIKVTCFWFFYNLYIFILFIAGFFGLYGILFDYEFFLSDAISVILKRVLFVATLYLWIVGSVLLWIFIFWMIIIIFVPFFIIVPIPFIPFFIPIPLKMPMLLYIPPFKLLTDRGILPLMRRIIFSIILSEKSIKNKFTGTFHEIFVFLYEELKLILTDFFKVINFEPVLNKPSDLQFISKGIQDDDYKIDTVDTDNKNNEDYEKEDNNKKYEKAQQLIKEELDICLKTKRQFTTPDMDSITSAYANVKDMNNYFECYSQSIKSYIDNKI